MADSLLQSVAIPHGSGTANISYLYDSNGRLSAVLSGIAREYAYNGGFSRRERGRYPREQPFYRR